MKSLKVYSLFQQRAWKAIIIPQIRLQGKYLQEAGFHAGTQIDVTIKKGEIVIKKRN